jgi:beta-galactosidase/beta-glucuronidase
MESKILTVFLFSFFCVVYAPVYAQKKDNTVLETLDLSGDWKLFLDQKNTGITENKQDSIFKEAVALPGTLEQNAKGKRVEKATTNYLNQSWQYTGAAWYQKEIEIPESWGGKQIQLFLERTKASHIWFNEKRIGQA